MDKKKVAVDELLESVRVKVYKKFKTPEECAQQIAKIDIGAKKFDDSLNKMKIAAQDRASGKISSKEMNQVIHTEEKIIREPCKLLMIHLHDIVDKTSSVTKEEIKLFRDYVRGLKKIFKEHLKALNKESKKPVTESYINDIETNLIQNAFTPIHIAMESVDISEPIDFISEDNAKALNAFAMTCESLKISPSLNF